MDGPTSFAHALLLEQRARFLLAFEQFLVSSATPVEARRYEAKRTEDQISDILDRLKAQRII